MCMRTNIVLNDDLVKEAMQFSRVYPGFPMNRTGNVRMTWVRSP